MKLTNEEIARVFAMYWSSQYTKVYPESNLDTSRNRFNVSGSVNSWGKGIENRRLVLTPVSKISDEDAIEVAKIHERKYWVGPGASQSEINSITTEMIRDNLIKEGSKLLQHYEEGHRWYEGGSLQWLYSFQYLILKGYAVPLFFSHNHWANGKTAIELELAVEKN